MAQKIGAALILVFCWLAADAYAGPEPFPPVSGEIFGQAGAGVKSITVNGKPVSVEADNTFRAPIQLKSGEKYLVLNILYDNLRIIKKYLILRRQRVEKFQVYVPKEKIEKPAEAPAAPSRLTMPTEKVTTTGGVTIQSSDTAVSAPAAPAAVPPPPLTEKKEIRRAAKPIKKIVKLAKKIRPSKIAARPARPEPSMEADNYQYVWEFSPGKILIVSEAGGEYSGEIFNAATREWRKIEDLSREELRNSLDKPIPDFKSLRK